MIKFTSFICTFLLFCGMGSAQNSIYQLKQADWQQKVDHRISVTYYPESRTVSGNEFIEYYNQSPNTLTEIYFHLWPNAYKNKYTAYAKEDARKTKPAFYFNHIDELGYIDSLAFSVNGSPANLVYDENHPDIGILKLPQPLKPGEHITIFTPFRVKLPKLTSRMGYSKDQIALTQWYPKPATYDVQGWHPMPYADQGEYYNEFGTYTVSISIPSDYIVAATGNKILGPDYQVEPDSVKFDNKTKDTFSENTHQISTWVFTQDRTPDFAWFASKKFKVFEKTIKIGNKNIATRFFKLNNGYNLKEYKTKGNIPGKEVLSNIEKGLKYYSQRVGLYPYDVCTVVEGDLLAGEGMEYPTITLCKGLSAGTVIHEVGHNWFQCILGSNERVFPFMDESINTFYHQQASKEEKSLNIEDAMNLFNGDADATWLMGYGFMAGDGCLKSSTQYSEFNYGSTIYTVAPYHFSHLQEYLGKSSFDSCIKNYFRMFAFKHPLPGDLREAFESHSKRNLSWFFDGLLEGKTADYHIVSLKNENGKYYLHIKNRATFAPPVKISIKNKSFSDFWIEGFTKDTIINIQAAKEVYIDPDRTLLERRKNNNVLDNKFPKKWREPEVKFGFPGFYHNQISTFAIVPNPFLYNKFDGWSPGLMLYNQTLPRRRVEWVVSVHYGLKSKTPVGLAEIRVPRTFEKGKIKGIEFGIAAHRFTFKPGYETVSYNHFNPFIEIFFKSKKWYIENKLTVEGIINRLDNRLYESNYYDTAGNVSIRTYQYPKDYQNNLLRVQFTNKRMTKLFKRYYSAGLEYAENLSGYHLFKWNFDVLYTIPYISQTKQLEFRLFGSGVPNAYRGAVGVTEGFFLPVVSGNTYRDYAFKDLYIGRGYQTSQGTWGKQLLTSVPTLRIASGITASYSIVGFNFNASIPLKFLPLGVYFDGAYANLPRLLPDYHYVGGLQIKMPSSNTVDFEINLPLFYSELYKNIYDDNKSIFQFLNFRMMVKPEFLNVARQFIR